MNDPAPGWYPDPTRRFDLRYHNGRAWTADVAVDGQRFVDPLGTGPGQAVGRSDTPPPRNAPATAALSLGIIAIALGWVPVVFVLAAIAGVLAVVFGIAGRRRARHTGAGGGFALAGLITGSVGLLVCIGGAVFTVAILRAVDRFENPAAHTVEISACTSDGGERNAVTASGVLTNLDADAASFSVRVYFVRPGTDNPRRQALVEVGRVPAGATVTFEATRSVDLADVECVIGAVRGPLPFGVDPGT